MRLTSRQQSAYDKLEQRWESFGFEHLSKVEKQVVALEGLEGDVMNGGLGQYFFNSSGDMALIALNGLKELRANDTHSALLSAINKLWPNVYPTVRSERYDVIDDAEDRDEELLDLETRTIQDLPEDFLALALETLADEYASQI